MFNSKTPRMYDYDDLLTADLAHIAKHIARFENDWQEFGENLWKTVKFSVFLSDNITFPNYSTDEVLKVIANPDIHTPDKVLFDLMEGQDFNWSLYDKCLKICQENNLPLCNFSLQIGKPPKEPNLEKSDLELLKVPDIKKLLKKYGHSTSGSRQELVDRLWIFLPVQDTQELLDLRYQEVSEKYKQKQIRQKYRLLASFAKQRYYFFGDIVRHGRPSPWRTKVELSLALCQTDDTTFAELFNGVGYKDVIVGGKVDKALPLYPTDLSSIRYKIITK